MKAMVFAAGLGTRLKPYTNTMPKALVPIQGEPLLGHVLSKLGKAGFDQVVVNVHHFANQIEGLLDQPSCELLSRLSTTDSCPFHNHHAPCLPIPCIYHP